MEDKNFMKLSEIEKLLKKQLYELKVNHSKQKIIFQKKLEDLENKLFLIKRKKKVQQMINSTTANPNKRKKSEILGISTHGSIKTGISKIKGRKPINAQAARAVDFYKYKKTK